ncbi:MAG: response regulator transcription factor, partial [Oscillospiraceae bacterium]|nr:response regulator transcription factor [Oscillospiraceae bacterium]
PEMDGFDVCRKIREKSNIPIIMITAKEEELDKVLGIKMGADDYITKPFSVRELLVRIEAIFRRISASSEKPDGRNTLEFGELTIDLDKYEVKIGGKPVDLTLREFELLRFLATQQGHVFTREVLLEKVWGFEYYGDMRNVDVTVRRLRVKIEKDPSNPAYILMKRSVGYYFNTFE